MSCVQVLSLSWSSEVVRSALETHIAPADADGRSVTKALLRNVLLCALLIVPPSSPWRVCYCSTAKLLLWETATASPLLC